MSTIDSKRDHHRALVQTWMSTLGQPAWWDLMHEDIVLEFPYGPSLGQPERIVGRPEVVAYVKALLDRAGALKFTDIQILATEDPTLFVSEYRAERRNKNGSPYVQVYINKVRVKDGQVVFMREFWDPKRILDAASGAQK